WQPIAISMKHAANRLPLVVGLIVLALCLIGATWILRLRSHKGAVGLPGGPSYGLPSAFSISHRDFLLGFARSITNSATPDRWRAWAVAVLKVPEAGGGQAAVAERSQIREDDLPAFLPDRDALVTGEVVRRAGTDGYVSLCWGGHETFYGILA